MAMHANGLVRQFFVAGDHGRSQSLSSQKSPCPSMTKLCKGSTHSYFSFSFSKLWKPKPISKYIVESQQFCWMLGFHLRVVIRYQSDRLENSKIVNYTLQSINSSSTCQPIDCTNVRLLSSLLIFHTSQVASRVVQHALPSRIIIR